MYSSEQGHTLEVQTFSVSPLELVAEPKKVVNFNPWIYATNADRLAILDVDLKTYFAECLMLSTEGIVTLDKEQGFLHESGVAYRELTRRAIKHYASNPDAVERFAAEGVGFDHAQKIVEHFIAIQAPLPPMIIASPPGNVYDVGDKYSKSLTYALIPLGFDNLSRPLYRLIAIPTKEISIVNHWRIENEVANIQRTLEILGLDKAEVTANGLVKLSALMELPDALKRLANDLQFESWDAIEQDIRTSSLLEKDNDRTSQRRKSMLRWSADTIRDLVRDGQPESEFNSLQETLRQVFAAERGGKYTSDKYLEPDKVILEMEQLFVGNGGSSEYATLFIKQAQKIEKLNNMNLNEARKIMFLLAHGEQRNMMEWINKNPEALDSYVGTGCGSGGLDKKNRSRDLLSSRGQDQIPSRYDLIDGDMDSDGESSSSPDDIVVTLDSGETYVLKIREGWKCNFEGCDKVSNHETKVRIGICHICEYCDPNVHKAD